MSPIPPYTPPSSGASTADELTDVDTTGVVDHAILAFDTSTGQWLDTVNVKIDDDQKQVLLSPTQWIKDAGGGYTEIEPGTLLHVRGQLDIDGEFFHEDGGFRVNADVIAGNTLLSITTHFVVLVDTDGVLVDVTLPVGAVGKWYKIRVVGTNGANIIASGAETIDGSASIFAVDGEMFDLVFVGGHWRKM